MDFSFFSASALVVAAVYFLAGIIDSICGGGGLLTIPALMAIQLPTHFITGTNTLSALTGNLVSAGRYIKSGHVHLRSALITGLLAIPGGFLGAQLNLLLPERYLQVLMIVLLPVIAVVLLVKKNFGTENRIETLRPAEIFLRACLTGLLCGMYQGFYGPGGGTFYLLAFTLLLRLNMTSAAGNSRVAGLFASVSASLTYTLSGFVCWRIVLVATIANSIGNWLGVGLAVKKGARLTRPLLFVMMFVLLAYVLTHLQ